MMKLKSVWDDRTRWTTHISITMCDDSNEITACIGRALVLWSMVNNVTSKAISGTHKKTWPIARLWIIVFNFTFFVVLKFITSVLMPREIHMANLKSFHWNNALLTWYFVITSQYEWTLRQLPILRLRLSLYVEQFVLRGDGLTSEGKNLWIAEVGVHPPLTMKLLYLRYFLLLCFGAHRSRGRACH